MVSKLLSSITSACPKCTFQWVANQWWFFRWTTLSNP